MKKVMHKGIVMIMAFLLVSALGINSGKAHGKVSLQVFYDELHPYGTWMEHYNYGYVWIPQVERGFVPYRTNGYWVMTEYGNTWVSDYTWGWAPFHYGRWFYDDYYGWIWVPDTEWAPAWVSWRSGHGYYGWAPLMPGIHISVSFNSHSRIPYHYWNFVPYRYITHRRVYNYCVPRIQVTNIIHHTTIVTHNYSDTRSRSRYFTGPSRREIETASRERVVVHRVHSSNRPGRSDVGSGTVSIYKPDIDRSRNSRTRSMPERVVRDDRSGYQEKSGSNNGRSSELYDSSKPNNRGNYQGNYRRENVNRDGQQPRTSPSPSSRQIERQRQNRSSHSFEKERQNMSRDRHSLDRKPPARKFEGQRESRSPKVKRSADRSIQRGSTNTRGQQMRENTPSNHTNKPSQGNGRGRGNSTRRGG